MASQSPLLSLNGNDYLDNLLLSYVSSGDGGLNAILNLRQVCKATKNWVENLPSAQANQIFAKCQVNMELHAVNKEIVLENLKKLTVTYQKDPFLLIRQFLESPPPAYVVSSLKLSGVKAFAELCLSPEEVEIWRHFSWLWWERLENLEVDYVDNILFPNDGRLMQLLSAPSLKRLHCRKLEETVDPVNPSGLPAGLFYVEHLSIDKLQLPATQTSQFFDCLARTPKLKSLKLTLWDMENIEEVTNFLVRTKRKANLEVTLTLDYCEKRSPGKRRQVVTPKQLPPTFVSAVEESTASIRILKLHGKQLCGLHQILDEETVRKFFRTVENITEFETTGPEHNDLLQFPNLKRLGLLMNTMIEGENNKVAFPPSLQELSVQFGFPKVLPPSLTSFNVYGCRYSVAQMMKSLASLDKSCPRLKCLFLGWNGDASLEMFCVCCNNGAISSHQDSKSEIPFQNLRRLTFSLAASYLAQPNAVVPENVNGASWVLMKGFQLPHLSLLELDLDFNIWIRGRYTLPPVLDRCAMNRLVEGDVAKSLLDVGISESFVTQDALPLKKTLESKVTENAGKREKLLDPLKGCRPSPDAADT